MTAVSTACGLILEEGTDAGQGRHGLEALKASLMENCSFQAQCLNKFDFSPGNYQAQNVLL